MESKGKLILLLVAGLVVAFGAISFYSRMTAKPAAELPDLEPKQSNRVIVALRDLPPGSFVQSTGDIDWQEVPPESIKEDYLREGNVRVNDFSGAVVRRQLRAGEPVTQSSIMKAGEGGFLSAVLEPGMRAVSIAVNPTSGNAGFVLPGDRIDLIVTHRVRTGASGDESVASETFITDVRVVAVDQQLDNPENKAILAKTVTVEVTPRQAEQVAVAGEMGKISIVLRSIAGKPASEQAAVPEGQPMPEGVTDLYGNTDASADIVPGDASFNKRVRVIRGDQISNVELQ